MGRKREIDHDAILKLNIHIQAQEQINATDTNLAICHTGIN